MAYAAQRLLRPLFLTFAVLLGFLSAPGVAGQEIEGLHGSAAKAIEAQIRAAGLNYPQASIFYGDLTGGGTNDAISFVYYDSGGSAPQLATWIWREDGGAYTLVRTVSADEVFGLDPRDVRFMPGRIEVTTSVAQEGDPHCCPTGKRTFALETGASGAPENKPAVSPQDSGNWIATLADNPARVNLNGTATDGTTRLSGSCRTSGGPRFRGSLYDYPGDALERIDEQEEPVIFDVAGRNGTASFTGTMYYYAPEKAWVMSDELPVAFLDAFGLGDTLTIRNRKGEEAVTFGLRGSSKAVRIMRRVCG